MSVTKTMYVKENSFRKLDDPFNSLAVSDFMSCHQIAHIS